MSTDLHPLFVHFPIAVTILVAFLDWGRWVFDRDRLLSAGFWGGTTPLLILGFFSALASVLTGLLAEQSAEKTQAVRELIEAHELAAFILMGLLALLVLWRVAKRGAFPRSGALGYLTLILIAAALVIYEANLGAEMVYQHGVGVSRP